KEFEIGRSELANIWNLHYSGCLFDGKKSLEEWGPNVKQQAFELFNIQRQSRKKVLVNVFSTEMRVLHYLLNYVLMPRSSGHGHVKDEDVITMWEMANDIKINWSYFIVQHMLRFKKGLSTSGFGYVCLWTDVSGEEVKRMVPTSFINTRTLHHMGRDLGAQEEEEQPQEHQAGPSEQPSMRDMMQVLLRIEQNQANMGDRLQSIEQSQELIQQNQARMGRKIRRMEQYLYSEDEGDEDQD
ncbi:hypothetical protein PIB30_060504, partial [Stylosanthes scabra]|nr:hypothetical protein [Stylosanthes scabra]